MADEQDIIKLKAEIERLKKLAYYDELTGLLNRHGFYEEVSKVFNVTSLKYSNLERRIGIHIPFSLIFLDVDDFKKVNDTHGHEAGDQVLKNVAQAIQKRFRTGDIYARWGGEEFIVSLPGANINVAQNIAEKLREDIENIKIKIGDKEFGVTISIGITEYQNESLENLLGKADKAMYEAKLKGKNRVEIFIRD